MIQSTHSTSKLEYTTVSVNEHISHTHAAFFVPRRKIILPITNNPQSKAAMVFAKNYILRPDDDVVLMNVRPDVQFPGYNSGQVAYYSAMAGDIEYDRKNRKESHKLLKNAMAELKFAGFHASAIALRCSGHEAMALERKIKQLKPDLVIVGAGDAGVFKRMIGSISDYLVQHLNIPVLVNRN